MTSVRSTRPYPHMKTKWWAHTRTKLRMHGPSTRYVVLFRIIFNEFVLTMVVINTSSMSSKYNNIGIYISPCLHVIDASVVKSNRGHFWSGKCSSRSHHFFQYKLSIHVKTLLCISCTSIGVVLFYCFSFSPLSGWDRYKYHSWASHPSQ